MTLAGPRFSSFSPGIGRPHPPARGARACVRLSVPESLRGDRAWLRARELGRVESDFCPIEKIEFDFCSARRWPTRNVTQR
jgi:hypothetical protein